MTRADFHVHTNFCDGKNSPIEMVSAAVDKKLELVGVVAHSYIDMPDNSWTLKEEKYYDYIKGVAEARDMFRDDIAVMIGLELDYYSPNPTYNFDYVIGSVHVLEKDGVLYSIDGSEDEFCWVKKEVFGDDMEAMYTCYYDTLSKILDKYPCDIIGHFDLIGKYNDRFKYINELDPKYIECYKKCIDKLMEKNVKFEINTGCIYRGARGRVYPCLGAFQYILEKGGSFVLSSDAHDVGGVAFGFEDFGLEGRDIE